MSDRQNHSAPHSLDITMVTIKIAVALALCTALCAQASNCRLLAHVDKFPGAVAPVNNYAGCWGMIGSDGHEYALVTARTGTIIYDCQNPVAPVEVGFVPGPAPYMGIYFWREIRELDGYVYVSSEHGPVQVIDMRKPSSPVLVGTFGQTAHAIGSDPQRKHLWLDGGPGNGAQIYDVNVNHTNPPLVAQYTANFVHDSFVQNGLAYLSLSLIGTLGIFDVSNLNAVKVESLTLTPGLLTHSAWVDDEDRICTTTDENLGGGLTVYDVTNKNAPVLLSKWFSPSSPPATLHHQYLVDKVVHMSAYSDGYWAVDLSVPTNPQLIAHFDTNPSTGVDYVGAWGCYPLQPSGAIYLSDTQTGLWIVQAIHGVPRLYGSGTRGKGGFVPRIEFGGGFARVGNATFALNGRSVLGGTAAALLLGVAPTLQQVAGIELLVDLASTVVVLPATATGAAGAAGAGTVSRTLPIPNQPGIAGFNLYAQWVVADAAAPGGKVAASCGFTVSICP